MTVDAPPHVDGGADQSALSRLRTARAPRYLRASGVEPQSRRSASNTVVKRKITLVMTVRRSRFRSTTVEPAMEPPSEPPPNMSERPPPRPECNRIRKISVNDARIWMMRMTVLSIVLGSPVGWATDEGL